MIQNTRKHTQEGGKERRGRAWKTMVVGVRKKIVNKKKNTKKKITNVESEKIREDIVIEKKK